MRRFGRFACIDWSGARGERLKGIAVAECGAGNAAPVLVRPEDGGRWSRRAVLDWLVARADDDVLVGVDFSMALPFADAGGYFPGLPASPPDARALWKWIDEAGTDEHMSAEAWLADPEVAVFFRIGATTGARFASGEPACRNGRMRRVEREEASGRPASCFNLVGAAQVGKSSLTGMRVLHRLDGRVKVWPFDAVPTRAALIVEIYTSMAAAAARPGRPAKMRTTEALNEALGATAIASDPCPGAGPIEDHASDAILTAAWLRRVAGDARLWSPARLTPALAATEGWTFGVA